MLATSNDLLMLDLSPFLADEGCVIGQQPTEGQLHVAEKLDEVMCSSGFVYLDNFGLTEADIATLFDAARELFSGDRCALAPYELRNNIGYKYVGTDNVNHIRPADLKETFTIRSSAVVNNDYRGTPDTFASTSTRIYEKLESASYRLMLACALALRLPLKDLNFFAQAHKHMESNVLAFNHYPPCDFVPNVSDGTGLSGALRLGEHADFGMFTILLLDGNASGLQVRKAGKGAASDVGAGVSGPSGGWIDAEGRGGATAVMNIGAVMARWTNDRWRATAHRVVVPDAEQAACHRHSIPFFVQPDADAIIAAHPALVPHGHSALYPPITGGEHLQLKLNQLIKAKNVVASNAGA